MLDRSKLRGFAILLALATPAACSANSAVLPQGATHAIRIAADLQNGGGANANSPCDISGFWYFHGACQTFSIDGGQDTTVTLSKYKRLSVTEDFPRNVPTKKLPFITGEGTGDKDITGTVNGQAFPPYGSIGCINDSTYRKATCAGRAFLYIIIQNASSKDVGFNALPGFKIRNAGHYPGTVCELDQLSQNGGALVWKRFPWIRSNVQNGTITFQPWPTILDWPSRAKGVFGFTCRK